MAPRGGIVARRSWIFPNLGAVRRSIAGRAIPSRRRIPPLGGRGARAGERSSSPPARVGVTRLRVHDQDIARRMPGQRCAGAAENHPGKEARVAGADDDQVGLALLGDLRQLVVGGAVRRDAVR
jgi:hypothetical protein